MFELLTYSKEGYFGFITINRPQVMNALSNALVEEFDKVFDLVEAAKKMAGKIAKKAPLAIQFAKEAVNRSLEVGIYEGLAHESYLHALACATEDKKEGVKAFLEKRKPDLQGK